MTSGGRVFRVVCATARAARQRPRWYSVVVATASISLIASGCSGSGTSADDEAAAYCSATANLAGIETLLSPESISDPDLMESAFTTFRSSLKSIEEDSPALVRDDLRTLGEAIDDAIDTLAGVDFDITQLNDATADELVAVFERPEVTRASERIAAYDTLNCADGPASGDVTAISSDSTSSQSTMPPEAAGVDPTAVAAAEFIELIRSTFTDDEIATTLAYAEVATIEELADAIVDGRVTIDEIDTVLQRRSDGVPFTYGDDPDLDILWNACEADDWEACDGLFEGAPLQSLYQRFAQTCGRELEESAGGECVERLGG